MATAVGNTTLPQQQQQQHEHQQQHQHQQEEDVGLWPWSLPESPDASLWEQPGRELEDLCLPERKTHKRLKSRRCLYTPDIQGDLARAAAELLKPQTQTIAILVGSCVNTNMWPPTDTDGPGGAFALAAALWRLGKHIIIVTGTQTLNPRP
ncbi:hypothetical protein ACSSS7_005323 [Eimeria intestinalis]